ncbi:MAG: pilus assembly protein CpaA [Alphaproteobacteria bacterium]|nr:MAG: pilus assembly protein CpaA [Alphaproteobacteria bacterium]
MEAEGRWIAAAVQGAFVLTLGVGALCDVCRYVIPNAVPLTLIALFVAAAAVAPGPVDWLSHVAAAGLALLGAGLLFHRGLLGGGDVKLLVALALWSGLWQLPGLLVTIALAGGGLALVLVAVRAVVGIHAGRQSRGRTFARSRSQLPRLLRSGEGIPYGLAMAAGAWLNFAHGRLPGP